MPVLEGRPINSAGDLSTAVSWGELRERYDVDGFTVTVPDADEAERLVETNAHLSFADVQDEDSGDDEPTRAKATTEGVTFEGEEPGTCESVVQSTGEVCGRELPCPYESHRDE